MSAPTVYSDHDFEERLCQHTLPRKAAVNMANTIIFRPSRQNTPHACGNAMYHKSSLQYVVYISVTGCNGCRESTKQQLGQCRLAPKSRTPKSLGHTDGKMVGQAAESMQCILRQGPRRQEALLGCPTYRNTLQNLWGWLSPSPCTAPKAFACTMPQRHFSFYAVRALTVQVARSTENKLPA